MPQANSVGGAEKTLLDILIRSPEDIRWTVIFLKKGPLEVAARDAGARVECVDIGGTKDILKSLFACIKIIQILIKGGHQVVLGRLSRGYIYAWLASRVACIPCAFEQVNTPTKGNRLERMAASLPADLIIACSKATLADQFKMTKPCAGIALNPGTNIALHRKTTPDIKVARRTELGLNVNTFTIGIVGRLATWKGFHVVIAAVQILKEQGLLVQAVLVGGVQSREPDYLATIQAQVADQDLSDRIFFYGEQSDPKPYFESMDIFIHASNHEPFGLVIVEAMATGIPVIATDSGGPLDIIDPGVDGFLYPFGDAASLANHIRYFIAHPHLLDPMGTAARTKAETFSAENYAIGVANALRGISKTSDKRS